MRKRIMIRWMLFCLIILALSSCDDNSHNYKHPSDVECVVVEQPAVDTAKAIVEPEAPKAMFKPSTSAPNTTPSASANYDEIDNIRGFDSILENDAEDIGMRRYMENDDEEGWD